MSKSCRGYTLPNTHAHTHTSQAYEQKNIRRRVYDALNVLTAMNIIEKEKKEIRWVGLPSNSQQEVEEQESEREVRLDRLSRKKALLSDLVTQYISVHNLGTRNRFITRETQVPDDCRITLPFLVVHTSRDTIVECQVRPLGRAAGRACLKPG